MSEKVRIMVGFDVVDLDRIDAVCAKGKRGDWIRRAVKERLGGSAVRQVSARPVVKVGVPEVSEPVSVDWSRYPADVRILYDHLSQHPKGRSERQLSGDLDWMAMRVERMAGVLSKAGLARYSGGLLVVSV